MSDFVNLIRQIAPNSNAITSLSGGAWSDAFLLQVGDEKRVIRFAKQREDFDRDFVAGQFNDLPTPKVLEIGEIGGFYFAVSEYVTGTFLEELSVSDFSIVLPSLLSNLDHIHAATLPARALFGRWDPEGKSGYRTWKDFLLSIDEDNPKSRIYGWKKKLLQNSDKHATYDLFYSKLMRLSQTLDVELSLVHSDLINKNVVTSSERISGIFDWGSSIHGDFLYDYSWLAMWAPWYKSINSVDWLSIAKAKSNMKGINDIQFDKRFFSCVLHIGVGHLAYNVFINRDDAAFNKIVERMEYFEQALGQSSSRDINP